MRGVLSYHFSHESGLRSSRAKAPLNLSAPQICNRLPKPTLQLSSREKNPQLERLYGRHFLSRGFARINTDRSSCLRLNPCHPRSSAATFLRPHAYDAYSA